MSTNLRVGESFGSFLFWRRLARRAKKRQGLPAVQCPFSESPVGTQLRGFGHPDVLGN